ncbi:UNVERIFIED_CONTAM: Gfo/Idh/MocA family oxidoreductase [Actinomycetes bacterium ARC8]|uniref:Gfo/Idh/MocA family protein n=1 Tax=Glutamicibacter nicotianae TaxID=37929 RepID=UPI000EF863BA|nr:Gfo/Idh/MocA family oxidoreductase [Glutamicibacter nicotianae]MDV2977897.1 Gfo/Idh/MocA family oxidoreductase [Actinomycetes bacterium ARC8]
MESQNQPMGVGIVGAGTISDQYLENLTAFPDLAVRFIADLDTQRAASQARKWSVEASGTYAELLARDDIQIVVNLTIPAVHVEVALQAVAAGKHVWGEKPYALDRESGRQLASAAKAAGVRVAVAPDTILGAGVQSGLRQIESGAIGTPLTGLAIFQGPGPESWHHSPEFLFAHGAGPLFDLGPYYLTTLVRVFGPVAKVAALGSQARAQRVIGAGPKAGTSFPVQVPTHVSALLSFESGASAQCIFSFDSKLKRAGFVEISGTEGTAQLPDPNEFTGDTILHLADQEPSVVVAQGSRYGRGTGVAELAQAIREGRKERVPGELAFHVLDIMVSAAEAIESGAFVEVASTVEPIELLDPAWDPSAPSILA